MRSVFTAFWICLSVEAVGQNEFAKWYFGKYTGLDFMTTPPSVISHTTMNTFEGSASVCDAAGNLLFYTDGITIWNKQQLVMANGNGLLGNSSTVQSALIVKQPGNSNIYYVFTLDLQGGPNGLCYSLVDMNLAAGMGSVTVKNVPVTAPCTEQLSATRHCNGVDMWIITHDLNSNQFKSYLLTSAGLNTVPVVSAIGMAPPTFTPNNVVIGQGTIKLSSNGKKLGLTYFNGSSNCEVAVFDFDKSSGVVSNYLSLYTGTVNYWGCEFSPDGTKFYSGAYQGMGYSVFQWDLCAGTNQMILGSKTPIGNQSHGIGQLQLAPNGKIYVVVWNSQFLSTVNNPDLPGLLCGFTPSAQSVATGTVWSGLPNFFGGAFKQLPAFTYTVNPLLSCGTASFTAPPNSTVNSGCGAAGYSVQSIVWDFGQPSSGPLNTSTLNAPSHNYGGPGSFPVKLILNYACGADTIYQNVTIPAPSITVNSSAITCSSSGFASVSISGAAGPFTYTWLPSGQTVNSTTLNAGSYTVYIHDANGNCTYTHTAIMNPAQTFTGTISAFPACGSSGNGSASVSLSMGTGGTGNYIYNWSMGQNTASVSGLAAGVYSLTVYDLNCLFSGTFQILQVPDVNLNVLAPSGQVCAATLQAIGFNGTPPYSYMWQNGPSGAFYVTTQTISGIHVYTVTVTDQNGCAKTETTQVDFFASPLVTAPSRTACAGSSATLTAFGANSYQWFPGGASGATLQVSLSSTQVYTVTGYSVNGCSASISTTLTILACTGLDEQREVLEKIKIYPALIEDKLCIETQIEQEITVLDLRGSEMLNLKLKPGLNWIDASEWKNGLYIIMVSNVPGGLRKRIVKLN